MTPPNLETPHFRQRLACLTFGSGVSSASRDQFSSSKAASAHIVPTRRALNQVTRTLDRERVASGLKGSGMKNVIKAGRGCSQNSRLADRLDRWLLAWHTSTATAQRPECAAPLSFIQSETAINGLSPAVLSATKLFLQ